MKLVRWVVTLLVLTFVSLVLWTALRPLNPASSLGPADVIVVLGGGMAADGTLDRYSQERTRHGAALYLEGLAPQLHFSGGSAVPGGPAAGERMAALAIAEGVPPAAISHEDHSMSTLQNAVFSQPMLQDATSIILVTEAFHLPRSVVSMIWSGGPYDIQSSASSRFRNEADEPIWATLKPFLRETAAWWFNIARALVYTIAGWAGVPAQERAEWLT